MGQKRLFSACAWMYVDLFKGPSLVQVIFTPIIKRLLNSHYYSKWLSVDRTIFIQHYFIKISICSFLYELDIFLTVFVRSTLTLFDKHSVITHPMTLNECGTWAAPETLYTHFARKMLVKEENRNWANFSDIMFLRLSSMISGLFHLQYFSTHSQLEEWQNPHNSVYLFMYFKELIWQKTSLAAKRSEH